MGVGRGRWDRGVVGGCNLGRFVEGGCYVFDAVVVDHYSSCGASLPQSGYY